jgi:hypothetical protein
MRSVAQDPRDVDDSIPMMKKSFCVIALLLFVGSAALCGVIHRLLRRAALGLRKA